MARNFPVGYDYEQRVNLIRVSVYENVDFEGTVLKSLSPKYQ